VENCSNKILIFLLYFLRDDLLSGTFGKYDAFLFLTLQIEETFLYVTNGGTKDEQWC
jgi:hypothetical protein